MIEAAFLEVVAEPRYWEDADVNGVEDGGGSRMPLRRGAHWCPVIRLADGRVMDWPADTTATVHYKVCDQGTYWLQDAAGRRIARWRGHYVPDRFLCHGERGYGDYIIFDVREDGKIRGWRIPNIAPDDWHQLSATDHISAATP